jgi:phosphate starvation-inducible PhoH-like protein
MSEPVSTSKNITLDSREEAVILFGPRDQHLRVIREAFDVRVVARGDLLQVEGSEAAVAQTERVFQQLRVILRKNGRLLAEDVRNIIDIIKEGDSRGGPVSFGQSDSGKYLRPRTDGQARYAHALKNHDVILCVGPAGTGKTYMAVAWAVTLLKSGAIKKLVLVRPAVEAGERLGYLPGDFMDKVNPYLRPLLDALTDMLEAEQVKRYMANDIIEILPLAYMRGRTLNGACIILDEGQNATASQMKMFLTRMGHGSKIVVTGDMTQVDLPKTVKSGMADAVHRLKNIDGIAIVHLDQADIVRNPLVQRIVEAYDDENPNLRRQSGKSPDR